MLTSPSGQTASHIPAGRLRSPGRPGTTVCVWPGKEAPQGAGAISQTLASPAFTCYSHNRSHSSQLMEVIRVLFPSIKFPSNIKWKVFEQISSENHEENTWEKKKRRWLHKQNTDKTSEWYHHRAASWARIWTVVLCDIHVKKKKKEKRPAPIILPKQMCYYINDYSVTFTPEGWPSGRANVYDMTCQHFHWLLCYVLTPLH